ncbi:MAG TPA: hypothetical protein VMJ93_15960 [Verrucomicrobiae bacterium]|nr:hypothetical protein [Verrucomicrobiae bacterium]
MRTKIEIAVGIALLLGAAFAFSAWLEAHDDRLRLQSTLDAQSKILDQAKQQSAALAADEKQRDAALESQLATMRDAVAKIQTPQQIARWLPQQLPLPAPVAVTVPPATPQNPAPPATATIPQQDLAPIRNAVETCEECGKKLAVAQQDAAAKDQQLELAGQQLSAAERERDAAIKAAKGGGFWTRLHRNAKWFAIGAGAAASALCASGHCK